LISSIPYVKDWLDEHPQGENPNAPLICGYDKSLGKWLNHVHLTRFMLIIKMDYSQSYWLFSKLLVDPNIPSEDKQKIKELLKKPWNPYIQSALNTLNITCAILNLMII
jgi:hypothetical protein